MRNDLDRSEPVVLGQVMLHLRRLIHKALYHCGIRFGEYTSNTKPEGCRPQLGLI